MTRPLELILSPCFLKFSWPDLAEMGSERCPLLLSYKDLHGYIVLAYWGARQRATESVGVKSAGNRNTHDG